jgi:hypothetical protein
MMFRYLTSIGAEAAFLISDVAAWEVVTPFRACEPTLEVEFCSGKVRVLPASQRARFLREYEAWEKVQQAARLPTRAEADAARWLAEKFGFRPAGSDAL